MANVVLTTSCNKNCSYCFARDTRKVFSEENMTLENFKKILDMSEEDTGDRGLSILGGEPTQHPQFKEFLGIALDRSFKITLISNFLFSEDIRNFILSKLEEPQVKIAFLVNSTDLDIGNRLDLFKINYNAIYSKLYSSNKESRITCGITVDTSKSANYYLTYLSLLKKTLTGIESLRISLSFPGEDSGKNIFPFIYDFESGDMLILLIKKCLDLGIPPALDCIVFPCMFSNREKLKYVQKFIKNFKTKCNQENNGGPLDIFPNMSASFCYPNRKISIENIEEFKYLSKVSKILSSEYDKAKVNISLPVECRECIYYKENMCEGPCLAFFSLKD